MAIASAIANGAEGVLNFGGNSTTTQRTVTETHTQVGTSVSADQINVVAGGDLNMTGSAISAAGDVRLAATGRCHVQVSATLSALNFNPCFFKDPPRLAGL